MTSDPWLMFLVGLVVGMVLTALVAVVAAEYGKSRRIALPAAASKVGKLIPLLIAAFVVVALLAPQAVTLAQTPVPITIDTNEIFTQTNNWITQFTPIQAIGIGASLALAILGFLAAVLVNAFRGARA